jgi:hypothetical protein
MLAKYAEGGNNALEDNLPTTQMNFENNEWMNGDVILFLQLGLLKRLAFVCHSGYLLCHHLVSGLTSPARRN